MVRALGGGDRKWSSIHGTTSPLLTALRLGVRALDREADPVEASRLAGDSVAVRLGGRRHSERGRRKLAAYPTGRCGIAWLRRGTCTCPAARSVTLWCKLFRRFANNLDRPQEIGRCRQKTRQHLLSGAPPRYLPAH